MGIDYSVNRQSEILKDELNQRQVELIRIDLDTAFTFAKIAKEAGHDVEKRQRNARNARQGYEAVTHFIQTAQLDPNERTALDRKISELRELLSRLGEHLSAQAG